MDLLTIIIAASWAFFATYLLWYTTSVTYTAQSLSTTQKLFGTSTRKTPNATVANGSHCYLSRKFWVAMWVRIQVHAKTADNIPQAKKTTAQTAGIHRFFRLHPTESGSRWLSLLSAYVWLELIGKFF